MRQNAKNILLVAQEKLRSLYVFLKIYYEKASRFAVGAFEQAKTTENLIMITLAIIIGALAGLGAVGVRALIKEISFAFFSGDGNILENIAAAPWYIKLLMPVLGGLIIGPVIHFFAPEAKGTGVPEVMHSVLAQSGHIRRRVAFVKALVSSISIGSGGSVGREGPIVQIGASIGSTVGQFFKIPARRVKTLIGCGAAAGIAAAFNAPVAGALFAVEIILMDYAVAQFSPIVVSSVMATVISHAFAGDFPAMQAVGEHFLHSPWEIGAYFLFGSICGVFSYIFINVLYSYIDVWDKSVKIPDYFKPAAGGLVIGAVAIFFPQIMGVGYEAINIVLNEGTMPYMGVFSGKVNAALGANAFWLVALTLVFVKIFATSTTLASGGSGGIFAPSLFIGAMLGGAFGFAAHSASPDLIAPPATYALIGMGGVVAGTTRAPITAIITIFELTKETSLILPLMIVSIMSAIVSSKFSSESIYTMKLLMRDVKVRKSPEINIMKSIYVRDVYSAKFESTPQSANFAEIVEAVASSDMSFVSVRRDHGGEFVGVVSLRQMKGMLFESETLKYVCVADDIADKSIARVYLDEDCRSVLKKMRRCKYNALPVVDPKSGVQIGLARLFDIVAAYESEIEKIDVASDLAHLITMSNREKDVRFLEGYEIAEIPAPQIFVGKTIKELNIRSVFGVDVLSIKAQSESRGSIRAIPQSDYAFVKDDLIVVAGRVEDIVRLKNMR